MADPKTLQVSVVTPEGSVLDTEARSVVFPAHDGEMGILPNRAPLLAKLGIGLLKVDTGSEKLRYYVEGGFAQVVDNKLAILTEDAQPITEVDPSRAEELWEEAQKMIGSDAITQEAKDQAAERLRVQRRLSGAS